MKWTPDLLIALIIVVGCFILLAFKIDGEVKGILSIAAGWVFGSQFVRKKTEEGEK
jgi:uncharacterized membrane protein AbrB (regulator of aidB expression)